MFNPTPYPSWQGELNGVPIRFCTLLIQLLYGLCTNFPHLSCDSICDHVTSLPAMWLWHVTCDMWYFSILLPCVVSPNKKRKEKKYK